MSTSRHPWFFVDRDGLRKLHANRPKLFIIAELLSNAWDEASRNVSVTLHMTDVRGRAILKVTDDNPSGFKDISHAYTLFAESTKMAKPELRGRFNLGEKTVLALCTQAEIISTTAHVRFHENGERTSGRKRTEAGTVFSAIVRMTRAELSEIEDTIDSIIPPPGIHTIFNGRLLQSRQPIKTFTAVLPTVDTDEEGSLRISRPGRSIERKTAVDVFEPLPGESAMIYELGIPVVATDDTYHVAVGQKVPLTAERDNVTPSFLRRVRVEVLNAMASHITSDTAHERWVSEALGEKTVSPEAVAHVITKRFGERTVTADPNDREANARAAAHGYTVLSGGSFSRDQWANIRAANAAPPATVDFATPKILNGGPDAPAVEILDPNEYTRGMRYVTALAEFLAPELLGVAITTAIVRSHERFGAAYGGRRMLFNLRKLGRDWFDVLPAEDSFPSQGIARVFATLIHELAHEIEDNHLSESYHAGLTALGGKLGLLTLNRPDAFAPEALLGTKTRLT